MENVLQKCRKPIRIKDKYKDGYLYVPCGKCDSCLHNRSARWRQRLFTEAEQSAMVLFITLTYDNSNLPIVNYREYNETDDYDPFIDGFYKFETNRKSDEELFNELSIDQFDPDKKEWFFPKIVDRYVQKNSVLKVPVYRNTNQMAYASKTDVQKYVKRLRRAISYDVAFSDVPENDRNIRYFIVSEYGPETFRPHYHGLIFCRSRKIGMALLNGLARKKWKFCRASKFDISEVKTNAPHYVAKYVTWFDNLPHILQIAPFRPFYLSSRSPAIGSKSFDDDMLSDVIEEYRCKHTKLIKDPSGGFQSREVPYNSTTWSRLFPKFLSHSQFDDDTLLRFYSYALKYRSPEEFPNHIKEIRNRYYFDCSFICDATNDIKVLDYDVDFSLKTGDIACPFTFKQGRFYVIREDLKAGSKWRDEYWRKVSYSDIWQDLTDEEFVFGIPQNRHVIKVVRELYDNGVISSLHDYLRLMRRYQTIVNSDALDLLHTHIDLLFYSGISMQSVISMVYPDFVEDYIKPAIGNAEKQEIVNMMLSAFDVCFNDFFYEDGKLKPVCKYVDTYEYEQYEKSVKRDNIDFSIRRQVNYYGELDT